jgi:hypothetical protein
VRPAWSTSAALGLLALVGGAEGCRVPAPAGIVRRLPCLALLVARHLFVGLLSPMIQDVMLIGYWQGGSLEIGDRADHLAVRHIAPGIVVGAHHKNSRMLAMNGLHQDVEVQKILMILCQQHKPLSGAVSQVPRIADACQSHVGR